jgi:hypothetical protein
VPNGDPTRARLGARRGPDVGQMDARWGPDGVPNRDLTRARHGARRGPDRVPNEDQTKCPTGAKRGGGWKDCLLLEEKMTCSVYVSCKSLSTSDVFDVGWM